jgi:hypothetical protein
MIKPMQVRETKYGNVLVISKTHIYWLCYSSTKGAITLAKVELGKLIAANYQFVSQDHLDKVSQEVLLWVRS